jgi:hypothetical protein
MFFNRADYDLASAVPGSFALIPVDGMMQALERDYDRTVAMIFGAAPNFETIMESVRGLQEKINGL